MLLRPSRHHHPRGRCSIKPESLLAPLALAQAVLGARVLGRFVATAHGTRIAPCDEAPPSGERVAVIVPVLDERDRLAPCLQGLIAQGPEVAAVLVVDG